MNQKISRIQSGNDAGRGGVVEKARMAKARLKLQDERDAAFARLAKETPSQSLESFRKKQKEETQAAEGPTPLALADFDFSGFESIGMAPIVKPSSVPVGHWMVGTLLGLHLSSDITGDKAIKGWLLELEAPNKVRFLFPMTGTIAMSLGREEGAKKLIGRTLAFQRLADGHSRKYNGNLMFSFACHVGPKKAGK